VALVVGVAVALLVGAAVALLVGAAVALLVGAAVALPRQLVLRYLTLDPLTGSVLLLLL
jgi:hypothetical protein